MGGGAAGAAKMWFYTSSSAPRTVRTGNGRWRGETFGTPDAPIVALQERRRDGTRVDYVLDPSGDLVLMGRQRGSSPTQIFTDDALRALTTQLKASGSCWHGGFRSYEPRPGEYISESTTKLVEIANTERRTALATFNGKLLVAHPGDPAEAVRQAFDDHFAGARSSRTEERRYEKRRRRYAIKEELLARERAAAPVGAFKIFRLKEWAKARKVNTDSYGKGILDYAERWARLLQGAIDEAGINDGRKQNKPAIARIISEQAKRLSRLADTGGVTGFMHGAAVATLGRTWKHGELLRRWHNLDAQLSQEGVIANQQGGVLNPAILRLATSSGE